VYSTFKKIDIRDSLIEGSNLKTYFQFTNIKRGKTVPESSYYDTFNKAAPILLIITWSLILLVFILQKTVGIF